MNLSKRLKDLREEKGICQKELAAFLHTSIGTISNYEQNCHQPDMDTLCQLARFYGVTTDYLLGISNLRQNKQEGLVIACGVTLENILDLPEEKRILLAKITRVLQNTDF